MSAIGLFSTQFRRPVRWTAFAILAAFGSGGLVRGEAPAPAQAPGPLATRVRVPVALCLSRDGTRLFVANRRSGSLSIVDTGRGRVESEHEVGQGLASLVLLAEGQYLLAVDQPAAAVDLIDVSDATPRVAARLPVAADPVTVVAGADGRSAVVASLWSRRLTFLRLAANPESGPPALEIARTLELPLSPRNMAFVRAGTRLIVADAFGGRLAVVDPERGTLERVRTLPAHNIRGLAASPDGRSLVVAHQVLLPPTQTTYEDIHWGLFVNNDLRVLDIDRLLGDAPDDQVVRLARQINLGDPGNGSGDPATVAFDRKGHMVVVLSGIDEVLVGAEPGNLSYRPFVGRRPMDVAISPDGRHAYVADSLDDTVSVIDLEEGLKRGSIGLGPTPEPTPAERGERMFFDARISHGGWMSCHSCHTDGHTSGVNSDTLGDGDFGAPKRVPSLLGVAKTPPWGWSGKFERLEDQVRQSIDSTMQGLRPSDAEVADLVAYLRTLPAPPAATVAPAGPAESAAGERGQRLFDRECARCHAAPEYTTPRRYDVGLPDEAGNRRFNPPSLRGVGRREPLLHDGRARTLEEVFAQHKHPEGLELAPAEVADLVAFLRRL